MPKRKWDAFKNDPRTISLPTSQSKSKIDEIELNTNILNSEMFSTEL